MDTANNAKRPGQGGAGRAAPPSSRRRITESDPVGDSEVHHTGSACHRAAKAVKKVAAGAIKATPVKEDNEEEADDKKDDTALQLALAEGAAEDEDVANDTDEIHTFALVFVKLKIDVVRPNGGLCKDLGDDFLKLIAGNNYSAQPKLLGQAHMRRLQCAQERKHERQLRMAVAAVAALR